MRNAKGQARDAGREAETRERDREEDEEGVLDPFCE